MHIREGSCVPKLNRLGPRSSGDQEGAGYLEEEGLLDYSIQNLFIALLPDIHLNCHKPRDFGPSVQCVLCPDISSSD